MALGGFVIIFNYNPAMNPPSGPGDIWIIPENNTSWTIHAKNTGYIIPLRKRSKEIIAPDTEYIIQPVGTGWEVDPDG